MKRARQLLGYILIGIGEVIGGLEYRPDLAFRSNQDIDRRTGKHPPQDTRQVS